MEKIKNFGADEEVVLAPENAQADATDEPVLEVVEEPRKHVFAVNEIHELRKENCKVFRMSDGTEQAVFYPEAVHVFNEETEMFDDVDNALTEEEDGLHVRNGRNRFLARFNKSSHSDELFSVERGTHSVTVLAKENKKRRDVAGGLIRRDYHHANGAHPAKEVLLFKDVLPAAELEYSMGDNGVKENIVVKEKAEVYQYPFLLECRNVTAKYAGDEKQIRFFSTENDEEVFCIPAPFMTDANGAVSTDVFYEIKPLDDGKYAFTVTADSEWMNAEERVFPVNIDPQIAVSGTGSMTTYSWSKSVLSNASLHSVGLVDSGSNTKTASRMYMNLTLPTLPRNPRIKKAELTFNQSAGNCQTGVCPKMGLYQVTGNLTVGTCTPAFSTELLDYARMKSGQSKAGEVISYTFDITTLIDQINKGETTSQKLVLKMLDESSDCNNSVTLYGASSTSFAPTLSITYESSYGVNTSYHTHTHELGCFGQGSIDLQCGNLMFDSEDFAWGGNRMPVTLRHLYNSALASYAYTANSAIKLNTADFSTMKLGYGWKLNVMQSMVAATFQHEGTAYSGYVHVDEYGAETFFKKSDKTCCPTKTQCYYLYEDVNGSGMLYNPVTRELDNGSEKDLFDDSGRLICRTDAYGNHMDITYTSGRITSVKDGAGRAFGFVYNTSGNLTSITAPDGTSVQYGYTGNLLSSVTYPDGSKAEITSSSNLPATILLKNSSGASLYKVVYSFSGNYVSKVTESGVENGAFVTGVSSAYSYSAASGSTTVQTTEPKDTEEGETTDTVTKTVYTFDDDGNVVSEYVYTQDTGNVGASGEESGIRPHSGNGVVSNINNLLTGHQFDALSAWSSMPGNSKDTSIQSYASESYAQFGRKVLRMESNNTASTNNGMYQATNVLPAGQYTFSAYLRVLTDFTGATRPGAFLRVTDTAGSVLAESERISKSDTDYVRLAASFALTASKNVQVQILMDGKGAIYADAAQLENNPYVNAYNMLENGNFERGVSGWVKTDGVADSTGTRFNMSHSLTMTGDLDSSRYAYQDVMVKASRSTRETFTLSGWAKGYGLVNHERDYSMEPRFRLYAEVQYNDATYHDTDTEIFAADFSPCTEEWQFASVEFSKSRYREISRIRVYCDYSNNFGTVFFDDIQLVRNNLETGLTASDFVVETSDGSDDQVKQDTAPTFEEQRDKFGNVLTETTFRDGEVGTIYRSFGYSADGNNLIRETDARGNKNAYTVDDATSRNKEVTDRLGNKTAYEYDKAGRTTKVTSKNASGTALATVSYAYDGFNNLTEITRGDGMKYALAYNAFHNLESVGINGKSEKLVKYTYKNGNGRLKAVTYANGHTVKATYNSAGQMTAEKWYASSTSTTLIAHYKYVYDGQGNIVRSIDMLQKKEYTYAYDFGKIVRATECDITLNGEVVTGKTLVNSILYTYDGEGKLAKKRIVPASGTEQVIYCENPENESTVVKFTAGGKTVTSHSKTDSFGRKVFDELQLGTGVVSRQFSYLAGKITDEHTASGKQKSTPTTQLVSQIVLSDGRTLKYEYDAEDRITKVTDSVDGTTVYTYDALGQLLTETRNGTVVNTMTYDNYGNIKTKNGKTYTYGDSVWKDKLTAYDGKSITYDAQGNPTSYLGHTLAWEKGRQLKSFDSIAYTYNANGIRTSKTVSGVKHTYVLDGMKILRETWGSNTLIPLYDNEDSVCGILYNDEPYYFLKNLQGDIIAITDKSSKTVAKYSYDAWGACTVTSDTSNVGIATINPYRYRGYYYDAETGLYYLQSRYYDPVVDRFVNADDFVFVTILAAKCLDLHAFCYSNNNVVIFKDALGHSATAAIKVTSTLVAQMGSMAAAGTTLLTSIKAFIASIWNIFIVIGLLLIVLAAIIVICRTIENIHNAVNTAVKQDPDAYKKYDGQFCIYVLAHEKDDPKSVFYVGRTKHTIARFSHHKQTKGNFKMFVVYVCQSLAQSRIAEQCVLSACLTNQFTSIVFGTSPSNKIRGISKSKLGSALNLLKAEKQLKDTLSLLTCTKESDLLSLMGK